MDRGWSFRVLGALSAQRHDVTVDLGAPGQRAVLAALLLRGNALMTTEEIAAALWADDVPASAIATVRTYVYRLRRALGTDDDRPVIKSTAGGYALALEPGELDLTVFRGHLTEADAAVKGGDPGRAAVELRAALALWQGPALAGLPGPYMERQRDALERLRLTATDALLQAELDLGGHARVVGELADQLAGRPLDERLREMHMVALYRCGRQADALTSYQEGRRLLVDELGVDPGPALQQLYERILRADPQLTADPRAGRVPAASATAPAMAQLPPDLRAFAGRTTQLELATELLDDPRPGPGPTIVLVAGTAGVGKTTFAVHWAHRVADRFPDGHIYIDLHGFDPSREPTDPADAIRIVLQSLGVAAQQMPAHQDAEWALYVSKLAERRIILLLDNVRDVQQARPLLAGGPGSLVIVTSRAQLGAVVATDGAHLIHLDVLSDAEAGDLLVRRLGAGRVGDEPSAAQEIVRRCASLPLALAIVAARAATRPGFRLGDIAAELGEGLDALSSGTPAADARSVFSWSYAALSHPAARLFRLLALHPGPEVSVASAAALAAVSDRDARRGLDELADAVLLEERRPGRYSWHDLLRAYAGETGAAADPPPVRQAAQRRLFDHLVLSVLNSAAELNPHRPRYTRAMTPADGVGGVEPFGYAEALNWTTIEHPVLLAAVPAAAGAGFPEHAWHLARELETFQVRRGYWQEMVAVQQIAARCARQLGDAVMEAEARHSQGKAHASLAQYDEAHRAVTAALVAYRQGGHREGEASCLISLADAEAALGRTEEARRHHEESIALSRAIGDQVGLAAGLNNLACLLSDTGDQGPAIVLCQDALSCWYDLGDEHGAAHTHQTLGLAYLRQGDHAASIPELRASAVAFEALGTTLEAGTSYVYLGESCAAAGDAEAAVAAWRRADDLLAPHSTPDAVEIRDRLRGHLAPASREAG